MVEGRFLAEHYTPIVITIYTLLLAVVIFFLAIPLKVQLVLLIVAVAAFLLILRPVAAPHEPPMGGHASSEGIARHTGTSSGGARPH